MSHSWFLVLFWDSFKLKRTMSVNIVLELSIWAWCVCVCDGECKTKVNNFQYQMIQQWGVRTAPSLLHPYLNIHSPNLVKLSIGISSFCEFVAGCVSYPEDDIGIFIFKVENISILSSLLPYAFFISSLGVAKSKMVFQSHMYSIFFTNTCLVSIYLIIT